MEKNATIIFHPSMIDLKHLLWNTIHVQKTANHAWHILLR